MSGEYREADTQVKFIQHHFPEYFFESFYYRYTKRNDPKSGAGFATLEIVIALALTILGVSSATIICFNAQSLMVDTELSQDALYKSQKTLEAARAAAKNDWSSVVSSISTDGIYTEELEISDVDEFLESITGKVSWQAEGQTRSVELTTEIADLDSALAQGSCDSEALGDWTAPTNVAIALSTTGPVTGVDVKDGIAYVTADGNSTQKDFFAINTASGSVLWSMNTGPGLKAVKVSGNYAYVANSSITAQLQVINLSAHSYIGYKLPGSSSGDTANTLNYYDHKIYLGIPKSAIEEFHIIDVTSSPNEVGKWEFDTGINAIYVSSGIAYVATPDNQELKMLDVHDPANISLIGGYDAVGGSGNGKSFARKGQRLFLGRTFGNDELYVLHIGDLSHGAVSSANINSSVNGLSTIGNLVFLATIDPLKEFQVWQVADDDSSFSFKSSLDLPAKATAIDCEGQTVYVTTEDPTHGLYIISSN